jgi:hypothetical protein
MKAVPIRGGFFLVFYTRFYGFLKAGAKAHGGGVLRFTSP